MFDSSKAIIPVVKDPYAIFATPTGEVMIERFKGYGNSGFSQQKSEEEWKKEGGIRRGQWVDPVEYNVYNLPPWCYEKGWDKQRRCHWINNRNKRMKDKRETEAKKVESERRFKALRLHTVEEMKLFQETIY